MALSPFPNGRVPWRKRGIAHHPKRALWSSICTRFKAVHRRDGSACLRHVDKCVRSLKVRWEYSNLKMLDYIHLHYIHVNPTRKGLFSLYRATVRQIMCSAFCGAIPAIPYLLTPVPQISPPTTYPILASVATKYLNGYNTIYQKLRSLPAHGRRATATPLTPLPPSAA
jgi:hypothetical protein